MKLSPKRLARISVYGCIIWVGFEGLFLVLGTFGWEPVLQSLRPFSPFSEVGWGLRVICGVIALFLFALFFLALLDPWLSSNDEPIHLENDRGNVWLSSRTISEYIQRKSSKIEEVESLKVRVTPSGERVSLQVDVSLQGETPLPEVTERIQRFIEQELRETIGVEKVEGIHIHFTKIGALPEKLPAIEAQDPATSIPDKSEAIEPEEVETEVDK